MHKYIIAASFFISVVACNSGSTGSSNKNGEHSGMDSGLVIARDIQFEKLIYHSSRCNGSCPKIDLQIDSNKNISVNREFFVGKGTVDSAQSGFFKGALSPEDYHRFLKTLEASKYDSLVFPGIDCCDAVVTTLIIYSGGKRKYLKSMTPPAEAAELIALLKKTGAETQLNKITDPVSLEE